MIGQLRGQRPLQHPLGHLPQQPVRADQIHPGLPGLRHQPLGQLPIHQLPAAVQAVLPVLPVPPPACHRTSLRALLRLRHRASSPNRHQRFSVEVTPSHRRSDTPASYGAAVGDPARWPGPRQLYRAAGLSPAQYESAGRRRDGTISREGSVELRRALIDLGLGLWLTDPPSKTYAATLRARGKHGGVIACALAHRANRIAYALVRDQTSYDPTRWPRRED